MVDRMMQLSLKQQQHQPNQNISYDSSSNSTSLPFSEQDLLTNSRFSSWTTTPPSCAFNFHGLPRAFRRVVLPSIVRNILIPNAMYQCDVYVYFHSLPQEDGGRSGNGGTLDPNAVDLLRQAVHLVDQNLMRGQQPKAGRENVTASVSARTSSSPLVVIQNFTDQEFEQRRGDLLTKIRTTVNPANNKSILVPWAAGFTIETTYNVVRMYHAIQGAWDLMQQYSSQRLGQKNYSRVAIFRIDVFYATPIDIFHFYNHSEEQQVCDVDNNVAVVPAFARYPVNDRMMYGPYEAVQIYASRRFELVDRLIQLGSERGLHPETFLTEVIFPAIRGQPLLLPLSQHDTDSRSNSSKNAQSMSSKNPVSAPAHNHTPVTIHEDARICFVRARADESVWVNDCTRGKRLPGVAPRKVVVEETLAHLEETLGGRCKTEKFKKKISKDVTFGGVVRAVCEQGTVQVACRGQW
ncbi:hypothetical protein ACA910_019571 [Epithemia clementina (nom. ined.)]